MHANCLDPSVYPTIVPNDLTHDDAGLLRYIKEHGQTSWYSSGTRRMGGDATSIRSSRRAASSGCR
ncbi:MAG: hypothetical protein ACREWJ_00545 [Rhodoferax sp.]